MAADLELPSFRRLRSQYSPADVFNADETGLIYYMSPDRTIYSQPMPGRKNNKKRLKQLVSENESGTQKLPFMYIGNAIRPRCFKKCTGSEHGFEYWANKKEWMKMVLFFEWIQWFEFYI